MNIYPESLKLLIEYFKKLPGVGEKTAERYALSIINLNEEDLNDFSESLKNAKSNLKECSTCGHLTEVDPCVICSDTTRNQNLICVVEDYKSVFMFEKTGKYNGVYHVLGGLISPIDGVNPDDLNIKKLLNRCKNIKDGELIVALKPTIEGDTTTLYINLF